MALLPSHIDPSSPTPIWSQVEYAVRQLVAKGVLRHGEAVPSVRVCALRLSVSPGTVVKAYQRLVKAGVLEVRRGTGTFVSASAPRATRAERVGELRAATARLTITALSLGASLGETQQALTAAWRDLARHAATR